MAEFDITSGFSDNFKNPSKKFSHIVGVRSFSDNFARLIKLKGKHDERMGFPNILKPENFSGVCSMAERKFFLLRIQKSTSSKEGFADTERF